jgi:hypothetical protein
VCVGPHDQRAQDPAAFVVNARTRALLTPEIVREYRVVPINFDAASGALGIAGDAKVIPEGLADALSFVPRLARIDYMCWPSPSAIYETARHYYRIDLGEQRTTSRRETCAFCAGTASELMGFSSEHGTICQACLEVANLVVSAALERRGETEHTPDLREVFDRLKALEGVRTVYFHSGLFYLVAAKGIDLYRLLVDARRASHGERVAVIYGED